MILVSRIRESSITSVLSAIMIRNSPLQPHVVATLATAQFDRSVGKGLCTRRSAGGYQ